MTTESAINSVQLIQPRAMFEFWTEDLTSQQIAHVFQRGVTSRYTVGTDRLIQRYLEVYEYEALFFLVNDQTRGADQGFHFVRACHKDYAEEVMGNIKTQFRQGIGSVLTGYAIIDGEGVYNYLHNRLSDVNLSKQKVFSIKEADLLWKPLSPDMRAVIQTWMRKEVFSPETPALRRDPRGSRLNMADLVSTGVIYGLLRRGALRSDFAESLLLHPRSKDTL